jgi:hypothetical protein
MWVPFGLAVACVLYALLTALWDARRRDRALRASLASPPASLASESGIAEQQEVARRDREDVTPAAGAARDRAIALVLAFLFALLGTAAAAIDGKVRGGSTPSAAAEQAVSLDFSTSDKEHAAFTRIAQVHSGPLDHDLCLVRFYERERGAKGPWWTDCGQGRSLETVGQARSRLALRKDWGRYDGRAEYTVPKGTDVMYLRGTVGPQCRDGEKKDCARYRGGGQQYFFPEGLDPGASLRHERCAKSRTQDGPSDGARYGRC